MDALARQCIEIDGERGHQRLAFAGLHFGNAALMQHHAADELHIEVALAQGSLRGLAHGGKGGRHQIVQALACGEFFPQRGGAGAQRLIGEGFQLRLECVDRIDAGAVSGDPAVVARAKNLSGDAAQSEH